MPRLILGVFISSISLEKCLGMERNEGCYVCGDFCDCCFFTDALIKGEFPDDMRIGYRKRHIASRKEIAEACHIKGYFYWSFMDNFEWSLDIPSDSGLHTSMMMR